VAIRAGAALVVKRGILMGKANPFKAETLFLREFSKVYTNEIEFETGIEWEMRAFEIWLPDIHHALTRGVVISSELGDECAVWIVEGETCDEDRLLITLEVICDEYRMCVTKIKMFRRVKR
jgi:hypothetical protein